MPHNKNDRSAANAFIERLFRDGYHDYVRYTEINLQKHGSKYLSVSGCAEDVVQEAFYLICERAEEVMDSESPVFYIKSTDASGMPMPLRIFDFVERGVPAKAEAAGPDYARREDVDKLSAMYNELSRQYAAIARELGLAQSAEAQNG